MNTKTRTPEEQTAFKNARDHWRKIEIEDAKTKARHAIKQTRAGKMTVAELLELHEETTDKCRAIMRKKNSDYTGGSGVDDPFANFNMSSSFGIDPILGILLRVGDKMRRIQSFANDGGLRVTGETVFDACEDIVNYAILIKAMCVERARLAAEKQTYAVSGEVGPVNGFGIPRPVCSCGSPDIRSPLCKFPHGAGSGPTGAVGTCCNLGNVPPGAVGVDGDPFWSPAAFNDATLAAAPGAPVEQEGAVAEEDNVVWVGNHH